MAIEKENKFDFISGIIVGDCAKVDDKYIIYELVNKETKEVFYVGRTRLPLITRIKNHFSPNITNKELAEYVQSNYDNIIVRVIEKTESRKRERYWVKKRATEYNLFNKTYLQPGHRLGGNKKRWGAS